MNKDNLYKFAKNKDEKLIISRLVDVFENANTSGYVKSSRFLNGHEQNIAKSVFNSLKADYIFFGGYDEAERKIAVCYSDLVYKDIYEIPVKILEITCKDGDKLNHRDYLGSLMGLGIKREMFGDIICDDLGAKIFVLDDIAKYIPEQLEKVGRYGVTVNLLELGEIEIPPKKYKDISFTVSSLRLDAVIAGCCGISRSDAANVITSGNATVNWEEILSVSYPVEKDMIISVKGFGRYSIYETGGKTRKGRTFVGVKKYI